MCCSVHAATVYQRRRRAHRHHTPSPRESQLCGECKRSACTNRAMQVPGWTSQFKKQMTAVRTTRTMRERNRNPVLQAESPQPLIPDCKVLSGGTKFWPVWSGYGMDAVCTCLKSYAVELCVCEFDGFLHSLHFGSSLTCFYWSTFQRSFRCQVVGRRSWPTVRLHKIHIVNTYVPRARDM